MNATLNTRQIGLVALVALVVFSAGGFLVLSKHKSTTSTTANSTPARTTQATTTPTPSKTHTHRVTPAKLQTHGLPLGVARALQKHAVVVVAVSTPRGGDETFARNEARAGAAKAGVGYVAIDVFDQRPGTTLLRKLGVVDTPEILVIKRPGNIVSQFKGFVDRDVVEQAVADAR